MSVGNTGLPRADVPAAFDVGAPAYDRLVGASPGYHAHLRLSARRLRLPGQRSRAAVARCRLRHRRVDGCSADRRPGTPTSSRVDASRGMLDEARAKSWPPSVRFVHAPVEALAENGVVGPFDGILAAYLIRNLSDPDTSLRALRDLLAPRRHAGGARLLGARLPGRHLGVARGVLGHHHSLRLVANPRRDAVPASVAQRADI